MSVFKKIVALILILLAPKMAAAVNQTQQFATIKNREPSFSDLARVYTNQEKLTGYELSRLKKKAKTAAWLPTLYAGYDRSLRESEGISIQDNISVSGGSVTVGPEDNDYDLATNVGRVIRVRAVWRLDELVYSRELLAITNAGLAVHKTKSEALKDLYKIYEQRYVSLLQYLKFKSNRAKAAPYYAKFVLLTDQLDALTSGRFAGRWWREK